MSGLAVEVSANPAEMAQRAAAFFCDTVARDDGPGAVCLSGGQTPRGLYELLASGNWSGRVPWMRLHWFFGDERFVAPDDLRSNFRMAREALFSRAPIPESHIHPFPTVGNTPAGAADLYQAELRKFYGADKLSPNRPLFDVVLLGLGADGHTASLMPGKPEQDERERWVCAALEGSAEPRITLTPPALEATRAVAFLASGRDKRQAFSKLRKGDATIPAARIQPSGALMAFVDAAVVE